MDFPVSFTEKMKAILGDEYEDFLKGYDRTRHYGLRVNRTKITAEQFERISMYDLTPVPWIDNAFELIETWYQVDELKQLVKFIVFVREDNFDISRYDYLKNKGFDFEFQTLPYADISSTELRNKIKNDESIDDYVAQEVKEYIIANGLYKN